MSKKILIAYASKYGATREIAEKIGDVLQTADFQADVLSVKDVQHVSAYQAVILGSALYVGKWQKDAETFLKQNETVLANRPVWLFSSGPTGNGNPVELVEGKRLPAGLVSIAARVHPRDVTIFHGYINLEQINTIEKWAIQRLVKKPVGDYRDWNMIVSWANEIGAVLKNGEMSC